MNTCPNCKSDQIQSLRMAFEGGTHTNVSQTTGIGVSNSGIGVGGATTQSMSMSLTAQKVAPPQKKTVPTWWWVVGLIIFPPLLVWAIIKQIAAVKWNSKDYPKLFAEWERSWLCYKCGNIFMA